MPASLLSEFFIRDLFKLKEELNLYPDEKSVWSVPKGIANSAGTLSLHLSGNLLHFIGATLANSGYVRNRDQEFSLRDIPRQELLRQVDQAISITGSTLPALSDEDLQKDFPLEKHGKIVSTEHMLVHLLSHLGYHLGQVNYHRRLCTGAEL